jgi:DNA-binding SARP family transcriptional activator/tetratricopeptide (TPR) repeat protein
MDFRILGPLEVQQNGRSLPCRGAKLRLLLAVLLLHRNEVVSSDRLIEALWGDRPPATAAKALQMHVSQLRKLLEPERSVGVSGELLVTRPPGYELRVEPGQLDLDRFDGALSEARAAAASGQTDLAARTLADALGLWRGPPLADLTFEESLQPEIARLEELRLTALEDRIDADLALGRHGGLIGELEGLAAEHPLRERLRGQLMLALYRSGRQAEALDVYRETRRMLVDELGIEPTRELKALEGRILAQDPGLAPSAPEEPGAAGESPGLVGREGEVAELLPLVDQAMSGRGAVVLIAGEPGIGKSRLAEALSRHAHARGARIAVGRCWEAGGAPPYWPWVQALRAWLRETGRAALSAEAGKPRPELTALLPELGGPLGDAPAPADDTPGARFRLFESIAALLRRAAESAPLGVFLDDLHAADAGSLLLLRFVAGALADSPILVVGCYRDTDVGPELAETLAELAREPIVHRVALHGLDEAATSRLLAAVMGEAPPDELAARVHAETRGNPLFAGEIGRLMAAEGAPGEASERLPIPDGVREAIHRRLQRQSGACREVLALGSVLGREFELAPVTQVSSLPEEELAQAIEEATRARLVADVPGTAERVRFSHILVRDTLYEDLPAPRRRRLHLAVAEALEALYAGNPGPHLAQLAHHYVAAGSLASGKAIEYAERAGERAASQHAYEEAARNYSTALGLLEASGVHDPGKACELLLSLGESLSRAGSGPEAKDVLRRAAAIAEEQSWPDQLARAALSYGGRFAWARGSTDPALVPLLERALAAAGAEADVTRARLLARLAAATRDDATRERRVRFAEEAVAIAERSADPVTLGYALEGYWAAVEAKDPSEGVVVGDRLIALGEELGDKERVFIGHDFRLQALWKLGDRGGVDVEVDWLTRLAGELRQPSQRWHVGTARTMVALMEGRFHDAEQLIEDARAAGERSETWNAVVSQRIQLFALRRAQGRLAELEDTLRRSVHEYPTLLRFRCALAHLYAEIGDERGARGALDELLSRDLEHEYVDAEWLFAISLLPDVARFLVDESAAEALYALLRPHERLYAEAPVEATFGATARGLGVVATVMRRFDEAESHFEAAIELERRMGARPWLAHAQHDLAAMLLTRDLRGDRERAGLLLDQAGDTYRELGMERWAARAAAARDS